MKAAVCYEFGKPLVVEEVDMIPTPKGQVKIRLGASGVCHTDVHTLSGDLGGGLPLVAGHEVAGYVEEIGEGVTYVKPGDHVVASLMASNCGRCKYCIIGLPHQCVEIAPGRSDSGMRNKQGQKIMQTVAVNGFSEYCLVREATVVKIPEDMPIDRAAIMTCGVASGFGAIINRAQVKAGSSVVVIGVGGVGVNCIQAAAYSGAYPIIAVDILDEKLKLSHTFGATHTINGKRDDAIDAVKELTGGYGADYVFIAVGSVPVVNQGFLMSGKRGMTVVLGMMSAEETITMHPMDFHLGERMLTGCFMGSTRFRLDIPWFISLYKAGLLKLDEIITARYSLDQINEALASTARGEALRNVIMY
ncbi:zinc-binding dehydrogenase [Chloroflexota bacterium]